MLMTGLAKKMMMSKIGAGNAVKLGETNVYAILGSTKRGPAEFAKMAAVKADSAESSVPMKNVVNMPADSYFQGYMTCVEAGEHFKDGGPVPRKIGIYAAISGTVPIFFN